MHEVDFSQAPTNELQPEVSLHQPRRRNGRLPRCRVQFVALDERSDSSEEFFRHSAMGSPAAAMPGRWLHTVVRQWRQGLHGRIWEHASPRYSGRRMGGVARTRVAGREAFPDPEEALAREVESFHSGARVAQYMMGIFDNRMSARYCRYAAGTYGGATAKAQRAQALRMFPGRP